MYELAAAPLARKFNEEYIAKLSQQPMGKLYQEMSGLRREFEERGYLGMEDQRRIDYLTGAVEEKLKAAEEGRYALTEEVARAANLTQMLGSQMREVYKRGEKVEHDWYKGR